MHTFEQKVAAWIKEHHMVSAGDHVAVAVSGGMDSMALLSFFLQQRTNLAITVSVIHVDHLLRGEESAADRLFVENYAREKGAAFYSEEAEVAKEAERLGTGTQETARRLRYECFKRGMEALGATKLAVAHHADDQMETVLMQLTRGAHRVTGMPQVRAFHNGHLIRPLFAVTRAEIEMYVTGQQIPYRNDSSNKTMTYTRNRFRHTILPFLKEENQKAADHAVRFAREQQEDELFLQQLAQEKLADIAVFTENSAELAIAPFQAVPLPLQKRMIHLILNYLYHEKTAFSFLHIHAILRLLQSAVPSGKINLPAQLSVYKNGSRCMLAFDVDTHSADRPVVLFEGETARWSEQFTFRLAASDEETAEWCFRLPGHAKLPIVIRSRRDGDRIQLNGMNGTKKLARLFIDEKVPLFDRDKLPVVTDADGVVLWVPTLRKSIHEGDGPLLLICEKE